PYSSEQLRGALEPGHQRRRQEDAGRQHQQQVQNQRHGRGVDTMGRSHWFAENRALQAHEQGAETDQQSEGRQQGEPRLAREGRGQGSGIAGGAPEKGRGGGGG